MDAVRQAGVIPRRTRHAQRASAISGWKVFDNRTYAYQHVGSVSFARVSGALLLCAHFWWFVGCGVGDAGAFLFPNHVRLLPVRDFYGAAGARVGLEFPVVPSRFFVRAAVDLRAPINPANNTVQGASIFQAAGPGVGLGLGALVELPP
jgi:hypothetical protein